MHPEAGRLASISHRVSLTEGDLAKVVTIVLQETASELLLDKPAVVVNQVRESYQCFCNLGRRDV